MPLLDTADLAFGAPKRAGERARPMLTSAFHGRYYETTKNGRLFIASTTPLGLAIPIYTGTAPRVAIFNPPDSGVNVNLLSISAQRASGTTVEFAAGLFMAPGIAGIATGSFLTAFPGAINVARDVVRNGILGRGEAPKALYAISGTVTATAWAAGDHFYSLFHSYAGIGTSTGDGTPWTHDFDGKVSIPPGTLVGLAASVASVALYMTTIVAEEVDI